MSCEFCGRDEDCCLDAGIEDGRAQMERVFWVTVCEQRARTAEKKARACARSAVDVRRLATKYAMESGMTVVAVAHDEVADWHQTRADEHAAEAAQLRAWAAKS